MPRTRRICLPTELAFQEQLYTYRNPTQTFLSVLYLPSWHSLIRCEAQTGKNDTPLLRIVFFVLDERRGYYSSRPALFIFFVVFSTVVVVLFLLVVVLVTLSSS